MLLYSGAILLVLLALAHSFLGERYILIRLFRRDNLPKVLGDSDFTKGTLRFIWHLVSVFGVAVAVLLVQIAQRASSGQLVTTLGLTLVISALLPLYFTRARHLSWIVLGVVAAMCLVWQGH